MSGGTDILVCADSRLQPINSQLPNEQASAAVLLYVTAPNRDEALRIGRVIVEERLAACANVFDGMTSVYHWQGQLEESAEAVLILKTRRDLASNAVDRVRSLHPYDTPAILVLPIDGGSQPFLDWIAAETVQQP
jgi:periplasmic divalent cation tolerance protein